MLKIKKPLSKSTVGAHLSAGQFQAFFVAVRGKVDDIVQSFHGDLQTAVSRGILSQLSVESRQSLGVFAVERRDLVLGEYGPRFANDLSVLTDVQRDQEIKFGCAELAPMCVQADTLVAFLQNHKDKGGVRVFVDQADQHAQLHQGQGFGRSRIRQGLHSFEGLGSGLKGRIQGRILL